MYARFLEHKHIGSKEEPGEGARGEGRGEKRRKKERKKGLLGEGR